MSNFSVAPKTILLLSSGALGSWSNYPFFESGVVVVTSGLEGLFLLRVRARE